MQYKKSLLLCIRIETAVICIDQRCVKALGCSMLRRHISCYTMQCLSLRKARCCIGYQVVWVRRKLLVILTFLGKCCNSVLHCVHHDLQCLYQCFQKIELIYCHPSGDLCCSSTTELFMQGQSPTAVHWHREAAHFLPKDMVPKQSSWRRGRLGVLGQAAVLF